MFFGDHDFLPDGTAMICTIVGDVWRVEGLDEKLERVRWSRYASGLHQALGLAVGQRVRVPLLHHHERAHHQSPDQENRLHA